MLFKFTIMNLISFDLSSNFRGLSSKCTCMNHVSCNFNATYPHTIYVIHSISIHNHCLGNYIKFTTGYIMITPVENVHVSHAQCDENPLGSFLI